MCDIEVTRTDHWVFDFVPTSTAGRLWLSGRETRFDDERPVRELILQAIASGLTVGYMFAMRRTTAHRDDPVAIYANDRGQPVVGHTIALGAEVQDYESKGFEVVGPVIEMVCCLRGGWAVVSTEPGRIAQEAAKLIPIEDVPICTWPQLREERDTWGNQSFLWGKFL